MPIANQISAVVAQLKSAPKFLYGTLAELNLLADDTDWTNGVVMLYTLKPITLDFTIQNTIDSRYSLYMEFLYKTAFDEYTSQNETIVQTAYWLMKEFMVKMEYYRESEYESREFVIHYKDKATSLPVYNKLDVNSTGVNLAISLSKMQPHNFDPTTRPPGYVQV